MHLTPESLAAMYELVRVLPPFSKWNLPDAEDVEFHVSGFRNRNGDYSADPHTIRLSIHSTDHIGKALEVMAHEMLHMAQHLKGSETANTIHNADFRRTWGKIARMYGWDAKAYLL
jgi:hypothetical protein